MQKRCSETFRNTLNQWSNPDHNFPKLSNMKKENIVNRIEKGFLRKMGHQEILHPRIIPNVDQQLRWKHETFKWTVLGGGREEGSHPGETNLLL